jgi:hypothetical protein
MRCVGLEGREAGVDGDISKRISCNLNTDLVPFACLVINLIHCSRPPSLRGKKKTQKEIQSVFKPTLWLFTTTYTSINATMLLSKGIKLQDHDEKTSRARKCLDDIAAIPASFFTSIGKLFTACCSCTRHTDDDDEVEDDCQTLLEGRPIQFPRHAASSFLRTGTSRQIREANVIL